MNNEYIEIEAITRLLESADDKEQLAGRQAAGHFVKLLQRQGSEITQIQALRRDLQRLPPRHPLRRQIAEEIYNPVHFHQSAALRAAQRLLKDLPQKDSTAGNQMQGDSVV